MLKIFTKNKLLLFYSYFYLNRSEIAKQLKNKCYALVLCFNSFVSFVLLLCYREFFVRGSIFIIDIPDQVRLR